MVPLRGVSGTAGAVCGKPSESYSSVHADLSQIAFGEWDAIRGTPAPDARARHMVPGPAAAAFSKAVSPKSPK